MARHAQSQSHCRQSTCLLHLSHLLLLLLLLLRQRPPQHGLLARWTTPASSLAGRSLPAVPCPSCSESLAEWFLCPGFDMACLVPCLVF